MMCDTILNIMDDVIHFFFVSLALFFTLAFQAFWSFGMDDPNFETFTMALWTQFKMVVGDYPWPDGGLKGGMQGFMQLAYLFIFTFLIFFILLNFFLAIVVDAFSAVKRRVADNRSENAFFHDLIEMVIGLVIRKYKKSPS